MCLLRVRGLVAVLCTTAASGASAAAQGVQLGSTTALGVSAPWHANGIALGEMQVAIDSTVAHAGRASLRISAIAAPEGFAGAMIAIPARAEPGAWAGRRVRLSALLRADALGGDGGDGGASVWMRADDAAGKSVAFNTTQKQGLFSGTRDWTTMTVELDVPADASVLSFGVISGARGTLWADDVQLEVIGGGAIVTTVEPSALHFGFEEATALQRTNVVAAAPATREAARAITARGLANAVAFTRLLGYVRLFHPSDAAAATNWDAFAVHGMRAVEAAPDARALARTLDSLFRPIAPTVAVLIAGQTPPPLPAAPGRWPQLGVVFWRHVGFNPAPSDRGGNIYSSRRVRVDVTPNFQPKPAPLTGITGVGPDEVLPPDPRHPLDVDLGAGVRARVPLAVYTLEPTLTDSVAQPAPSAESFSVRDRATRLADVALFWTVMQHFYPYFDRVQTDWPAALRTALASAATDADPAAFRRTMQRLAAALHDGHAGASDGATIAAPTLHLEVVEGRVVVTAAADSIGGVRRGDEIVSVDGRPAAEVLREAEELVSGSTERWVRNRALGMMLAGRPFTTVVLRVRDAVERGASVREVTVTRTGAPADETRPEKIATLRPGVMYVDLSRITDPDFATALPALRSARAIVFDMRGYPRTVNTPAILAMLSDSALHSARFEVPIVTRPDRQGIVWRDGGWGVTNAEGRLKARTIFLTGGGAISYAETTMEMVEAYHLGDIVGEGTAGTNGNVDSMTLPGNVSLRWTGMRVRKHDGSPYHGVGVAPTVPAARTLAGVRAGRDEVLERALRLLEAPPAT